jgi:hypothetical protein
LHFSYPARPNAAAVNERSRVFFMDIIRTVEYIAIGQKMTAFRRPTFFDGMGAMRPNEQARTRLLGVEGLGASRKW